MDRTEAQCRSLHLIVCLALVAGLTAESASGWGRCGHIVVGEIAQRALEQPTRAAVLGLLDGQEMGAAGNWADEIRSLPEYRAYAPYHYVNAPEDEETVDWERDCPSRGCVLRGIEENVIAVRDGALSAAARAEALRFLIHFVGDIHQPLHVSHAGDRGGNTIEVTFRGDETNLHSLWDTGMLERMRPPPRWWPASCKRLARSLAAPTDRDRPVDLGALRATVLAWADESLAAARSHAYAAPASGVIDDAYYERSRPIVEERLRRGGLRLARLLEAVFTP